MTAPSDFDADSFIDSILNPNREEETAPPTIQTYTATRADGSTYRPFDRLISLSQGERTGGKTDQMLQEAAKLQAAGFNDAYKQFGLLRDLERNQRWGTNFIVGVGKALQPLAAPQQIGFGIIGELTDLAHGYNVGGKQLKPGDTLKRGWDAAAGFLSYGLVNGADRATAVSGRDLAVKWGMNGTAANVTGGLMDFFADPLLASGLLKAAGSAGRAGKLGSALLPETRVGSAFQTLTSMTDVVNNVSQGAIKNPAAFRRAVGEIVRNPLQSSRSLPGVLDEESRVAGNAWSTIRENIDVVSGIQGLLSTANAISRIPFSPAPVKQAWQAIPLGARMRMGEAVGTAVENMRFRPLGLSAAGADTMSVGEQLFSRWGTIAGIPETNIQKLIETGRSSGTGVSRALQERFRLRQIEAANIGMRAIDLQGRYAKITRRMDESEKRYFDYLSTKVLDAKDPAQLMSNYHDFERFAGRIGMLPETSDFLRRVADYDFYGATVRNRIGIEDSYGLGQYREGLELLEMIVRGDRDAAAQKVNDWLEYTVNPQFNNSFVQGRRAVTDANGGVVGTAPIYNPVIGRNSPATFTGQAVNRKLMRPNLAATQTPGAPLDVAQMMPVYNQRTSLSMGPVEPPQMWASKVLDFPEDMGRVYADPSRFPSPDLSSTKVGTLAPKPSDPITQIPVIPESAFGREVSEDFPARLSGYKSLTEADVPRVQAALYTDTQLMGSEGYAVPYGEGSAPNIVVGRDGNLYVVGDGAAGRVVERKGQLYFYGDNAEAGKKKALPLQGEQTPVRNAPPEYAGTMNAGTGDDYLTFGSFRQNPEKIMEGMQVGAFDEGIEATQAARLGFAERSNTNLPRDEIAEGFADRYERSVNSVFDSRHVQDIKRVWPDEVDVRGVPREELPPRYNYKDRMMFQRTDLSTPGIHLTDNPAVAASSPEKGIFAVRLNEQRVYDSQNIRASERDLLIGRAVPKDQRTPFLSLEDARSQAGEERWHDILRARGYTAVRGVEDYKGVEHNTLTLLSEPPKVSDTFTGQGARVSGGPAEKAGLETPTFEPNTYRKAYNTPEDEALPFNDPSFVNESPGKGDYGRQVSDTSNPFSQSITRDPYQWQREEGAGAALHLRRMFLASENPELVIQRIDVSRAPEVSFDTGRLERTMLDFLTRTNRTDTTARDFARAFQSAWSNHNVAPVDHITEFLQNQQFSKAEIRDLLNGIGGDFWKAGINWRPPGEKLSQQMHEYLASTSGGFSGTGSGARINATSRAAEKSRSDLAPYWQEALNEIQDLGEVIAAQSRVNEKLISRRGMVQEMYDFLKAEGGVILPEELGSKLGHNRHGWRTITQELETSLKGMKDADVNGLDINDTPFKAGMMLPAAYYNALAQMVTTAKPSTAGAILQWLNAKWKQHKIASPGAIVRDSASNFALAYQAGISPAELTYYMGQYHGLMRDAKKIGGGIPDLIDDLAHTVLKNDEKVTLKEMMEAGDFLHSGFFFREVSEPLDRLSRELINPAGKNPFQQTAAALQRFSEATTGIQANPVIKGTVQAARVTGDLMGLGGPVTKWLGDKKGMVDASFKGAVYLAQRSKGMRPAQAAEFADAMFFNYENVPYIVDMLRRTGISPFAAFQFLSAGRLIKSLYENPYAVQRIYRIPGSIREANEATYDKERRNSPQYIRNAMWIPVVAPDGTWIRNSRGNSQWLNLGAFLPETATGDMVLQGPGGLYSSGASPTFEFFSGLVSGRGYKGSSIYEGGGNFEQTLALGEEGKRQWAMGVARELWRFGATPWAPGSPMMERIGRSIEQMVDDHENVKSPEARDMMSLMQRIQGQPLSEVRVPTALEESLNNAGNMLQKGPVVAATERMSPGPKFDRNATGKLQAPPPDMMPALLRFFGITTEEVTTETNVPGSARANVQGVATEIKSLQKAMSRAILAADPKDKQAVRRYYQGQIRKVQLKLQVQRLD